MVGVRLGGGFTVGGVCMWREGGSTLHSLIALNMEDVFVITRTNNENKDYGLGSTELKSIKIIFLISTKRSFIVEMI